MAPPFSEPPGPAFSHGSPWLDAALAVGSSLLRDARHSGARLRWSGHQLVGHDAATTRLVHADLGPGLYAGAAGIALFLAQAGACAGEGKLARAAVAAAAGAVADCARPPGLADLSLYSGASGVALAALEVARRLARPRLRRAALALANAVAARVAAGDLPHENDLLGGTAGIVVALAAVHRMAPAEALRVAVDVACEHLVRVRQRHPGAASWRGAGHDSHLADLCGLAHGASGIAWALLEGADLTGERRFAEVAGAAMHYERSWFDQEAVNWPDLRATSPGEAALARPGCMTAWCHGALGIAALRWRAYERNGDLAALGDAQAGMLAARTLVTQARRALDDCVHADVSLCHGLGGAVELMLLAYEITGLDEHLRAARRVGELCLDIYNANGLRWTTGVAGASHVPGLMLGTAGVGMMLLRLHDIGAAGSPLLAGRAAPARAAAHVWTGGPVETQASGSA
jgi:lantibiotic modifying enzyme